MNKQVGNLGIKGKICYTILFVGMFLGPSLVDSKWKIQQKLEQQPRSWVTGLG